MKPVVVSLKELIDELAEVLHEPQNARELMLRAGFPAADLPAFDVPRVFWSRVIRSASDGKIVGGVQALIAEVSRDYPGNAVFNRYQAHALGPPRGHAPVGFEGATLPQSVTSTNSSMDQGAEKTCDVPRKSAGGVSSGPSASSPSLRSEKVEAEGLEQDDKDGDAAVVPGAVSNLVVLLLWTVVSVIGIAPLVLLGWWISTLVAGGVMVNERCVLNGYGDGSCVFSNSEDRGGPGLCLKIEVTRKSDGVTEMSAPVCSGELDAKTSKTVEYQMPAVEDLCSSGFWNEVCRWRIVDEDEW